MMLAPRQPARYPSFAAFFADGPYTPHIRQQSGLGALNASLAVFEQPAGEFPDPPTPDILLGMPIDPGGRARVDFGAGRFIYRLEPGSLWLQPAYAETDVVVDSPHNALVLTLPWVQVQGILASDAPNLSDFGALHAVGFRDELASAILRRMFDEMSVADGFSSRLFYESALTTLITTLWRKSSKTRTQKAAFRGGLAPAHVNRVREYIEEHIGEDVSLGDLAALAGLSPNHFCTVFRTSVGEPPYRFVLRRRIARAQSLLRDPDRSMTDIAYAVGFSSSGHFTAAFKKLTGVSPSEWRCHSGYDE